MNKISMVIQEDKNKFLLSANNTYNLKKGIIKKLLSNIPYSLFLGMFYPFSVMLGVLLFKNSTNGITSDNFLFGLSFLFVFTVGVMLLVFSSSVLVSFYYYKNNIDKRKDLINEFFLDDFLKSQISYNILKILKDELNEEQYKFLKYSSKNLITYQSLDNFIKNLNNVNKIIEDTNDKT